jgi:hypothetical protein
MVRPIEATKTDDEAERRAIMGEILAHKRDGLETTRAVLSWIRQR